jgi:hypothetical protein
MPRRELAVSDANPQVEAALRVLLEAPMPQVSMTEDGRLNIVLPDPRPLAASIAAGVVRSLADGRATGSAIQVGTLWHIVAEIEEGAHIARP